MRPIRYVTAAALLLASCKCAPKGDGGSTGSSGLGGGPFQVVPPSEATLSVLASEGPMCVWTRFDPISQKSATVAKGKGPCGTLAWSHDGKRGLMSVRHADVADPNAPVPREEEMPWDVFEVSFADGSSHLLGQIAAKEDLQALGFDPQGRAIATTLEVPELEPEAKEIKSGDQTYPIPEDIEGDPALAHAWVAEGGAFRTLKTEVTGTGTDEMIGTGPLEEELQLGPRLADFSDYALEVADEVTDDALKSRLAAACNGMSEDGSWVRLKFPTPLYMFEEAGELATPTLCLVTDDGKKAKAFTEANAADVTVDAFTRGPYVLLVEDTRHFARLYQVPENRLAGTARGETVTFWPDVVPAKAPAAAPEKPAAPAPAPPAAEPAPK